MCRFLSRWCGGIWRASAGRCVRCTLVTTWGPSPIGRELLRRAVASDPQVRFVPRAASTAPDYSGHVGWQWVGHGWFWPRER